VGWEELWYGVDKAMDEKIPMFYRMNKKGSEKVIGSK
jgi:hypothetical protein